MFGLPQSAFVSNSPVQRGAGMLSHLTSNYSSGPMAQAIGAGQQLARDKVAGGFAPQAASLQQALSGGLGGTGGINKAMGGEIQSQGALEGGLLNALQGMIGAGGAVGQTDLSNINRMRGLRDADYQSRVKGQASRELERASQPSGGLLGFLGL